MAMTMLEDWPGIPPAPDSGSFNMLRADGTHPLEYRVGRDGRGRFVFQLDAIGEAPARSPESPAGMDVLVDPLPGSAHRVSLILHDADDFEIFRILCVDLMEITRSLAPGASDRAMRLLTGRLAQWQAILARRRDRLLSRNEIIGLVGELLFLRDVLVPRVGLVTAINGWRGPFGDEQDFVVGGTIFEVKTQSTTSDRLIQISSEDQLDTSASRIVLCHQGVAGCVADDPAGTTLNLLVGELLGMSAAHSGLSSRLVLGLDAIGWREHPEYDDWWQLVDRALYRVVDGFPRIVPANLPAGVEKVRYQIRAADCRPFGTDIEDALAEVVS